MRTLFDEVVYVDRMNEKFTIEVNIIRQQREFLLKKKDFICYRSGLIESAMGGLFFHNIMPFFNSMLCALRWP